MSAFYNTSQPVPEEECIATIQHAIDRGCVHLDTSDLYGFGANEELVGE